MKRYLVLNNNNVVSAIQTSTLMLTGDNLIDYDILKDKYEIDDLIGSLWDKETKTVKVIPKKQALENDELPIQHVTKKEVEAINKKLDLIIDLLAVNKKSQIK